MKITVCIFYSVCVGGFNAANIKQIFNDKEEDLDVNANKGEVKQQVIKNVLSEIEIHQLLIETVKHVMEEDLVDILECEIDDKVRKVKMMDKKELLNLANTQCTVDDLIENYQDKSL